mgnify:CR=1 FL=1
MVELDILTPVFTNLAIGGVAGGLLGFAFKKAMKFVMIFLGIYAMSLFYLQSKGIIDINGEKLQASLQEGLLSGLDLAGSLDWIFPTLTLGGSFLASFALGWMKG